MPQPVDLTNCDQEPIHIPGSIQADGCMIVCDMELARILRHSINAPGMLGLAKSEINGLAIDDVLDRSLVHDLRNAANKSSNPRRPGILLDTPIAYGRHFDISVHRHNGNTLIEFEPARTAMKTSALELASQAVSRIQELADEKAIIGRIPRIIKALFGYDRVMIYRFADDGSGKVVSETKRADLESFLGQHFPASDIPRQARSLYLKNTIRLISDTSGKAVAIDPEVDASGEALDLSFAHLRSVSPIHIEYLRNMGVTASMSVSLIVDGELWGLIACHHYSARRLALEERMAAEMLGEMLSLKIQSLTMHTKLNASIHARRILDTLISDLTAHEEVFTFIKEHLGDFLGLIPADGIGVFMNGVWSGHGVVPPNGLVRRIAQVMGSKAPDGAVAATHELSAALPEASPDTTGVAGVLAIPLSHIPRDYLFFFRKEQVKTINWAGDPNKSYSTGPLGDRLTPRKSFAVWKERVKNQSLPWCSTDRQMAEAARIQLLEIILRHSEILAGERRKSEERQKILNEELNHRVKNILSLIRSIVSQPVNTTYSVTEFVSALNGRIMALSFAHDQITRKEGGGQLVDLLNIELRPYRGGENSVSLDGPAITLAPRAFSVLALVLHELTTNSAKYGALSRSSGRLTVNWSLDEQGDCSVEWVERGGPTVKPPQRTGFGSVLLHRSIPFDLNGRSDIVYAPDGLEARMVIPAEFVKPATRRSSLRERAQLTAAHGGAELFLAGKTVLLVEDQLVIALDTESILEAAGAARVHTVASAAEALKIVGAHEIDIAVLDVNLGATTSIPVADELKTRAIPFVFATGYGDTIMVPPSLGDVAMVRKPISVGALADAISNVLASNTTRSGN